MSIVNPYQAYQENSVLTASPQELTLMLYNGCLKFIKLAKRAMDEKKIPEKHANILKAQAIIQELLVTLSYDIEISKSMGQMYEYMHNRLIEANMKNDLDALTEVEGYVIEFRDTWKQVMEHTKS